MKFSDIEPFTNDGRYQVNQLWSSLPEWFDRDWELSGPPDLDPDFQRGHVWDENKQRAFVEFSLRGGKGSNIIRFNCTGWMQDFRGPFVLVDGKQRLESVRQFMADELTVFDGMCCSDFEDELKWAAGPDFIFNINDLKTRADVLRWYLEINSGGIVHTADELEKVRALLEEESDE